MPLNPEEIEWDQPKRWTPKKTRKGTTFLHFTNTQGQNNDVLTLRMRGNTGNINILGSLGAPARGFKTLSEAVSSAVGIDERERAEIDTGALHKILAFQNLYQLTREPMLLSDATVNEFTLTYVSSLFPQSFDFIGFFETVLRFSETADDPNSRDYSLDFVVQRVEPSLDLMISSISEVLARQLSPEDEGQGAQRTGPTATTYSGSTPRLPPV
jgi:hypothetical protein